MKVKNALAVARLARALKVRGMLQSHETTAMMALNPMVQTAPSLMVLRYFEPTRQWKPWMKVLLSTNMTPVNHQAHFLFQSSTWPTSHTSLTSGWRIQNSLLGVSLLRLLSNCIYSPNDQRGVEDEAGLSESQDNTGHEAEYGVGVWE